jgi:DNA-binding response OmpR family regulator
VIECGGGKEAVEVINRDESIDLVILDRRMPDLDGTVVLEEIRKKDSSIPVILLTGSLGGQTKQLKVDEFLMKPIDLDELLEKANKLLTK